MSDLPPLRREYDTEGFDVADAAADPVTQWFRWYRAAVAAGLPEPAAMVVATVDEHGRPDARAVLARTVDERGFVFYTNYDSAKSHQLDSQPEAAGVFAWVAMHRQVRVRGPVERVGADESDRYFATRPRGSQVAAWASPQSRRLGDREELLALVVDAEQRFTGRADVPRPPGWGGWRIAPAVVEFWQGRRDRLHDRLRYRSAEAGPDEWSMPVSDWVVERLAP